MCTVTERSLQFGTDQQPSKPQIQPVQPSSVLDKVRSFLPALQAANAQLAAQCPQDVDIEQVPEGAPHVEMDLACGILDLKDPAALARAEAAMQAGPAPGPHAACSTDDDEDSSENDEGEQLREKHLHSGTMAEGRHPQADANEKGQPGSSEARPPGAGRRAQKKGAGIVVLGD